MPIGDYLMENGGNKSPEQATAAPITTINNDLSIIIKRINKGGDPDQIPLFTSTSKASLLKQNVNIGHINRDDEVIKIKTEAPEVRNEAPLEVNLTHQQKTKIKVIPTEYLQARTNLANFDLDNCNIEKILCTPTIQKPLEFNSNLQEFGATYKKPSKPKTLTFDDSITENENVLMQLNLAQGQTHHFSPLDLDPNQNFSRLVYFNETIKRDPETLEYDPINDFSDYTFKPQQPELAPVNLCEVLIKKEDCSGPSIDFNNPDRVVKIERNKTQDFEVNQPIPNEIAIKNWLSQINQLQNQLQVTPKPSMKTKKKQPVILPKHPNLLNATTPIVSFPYIPPSKIVNYSDLPYMGEMTLDNCKPRRGRKPKKADICHLIYKNYGTVIPGTPSTSGNGASKTSHLKNMLDRNRLKDLPLQLQNLPQLPPPLVKIIKNAGMDSLLEHRETSKGPPKNSKGLRVKNTGVKQDSSVGKPLNLCIRDMSGLKIEPMDVEPRTKEELISDDEKDVEIIESSTDNLKDFTPNERVSASPGSNISQFSNLDFMSTFLPATSVSPTAPTTPTTINQKTDLMEKATCSSTTSSSTPTSSKTNELIKIKLEDKRAHPKTTSKNQPVKRKRSAIFIPPIPTENQNNPATEVSICKFKFTGGAKPSLQEKKMLSVDSGGNFRYYSGTGDKSMRGYEFFPRETLQQQAVQHGSSSGVFLNASGEKITESIEPPSIPAHFLLEPQDESKNTDSKSNDHRKKRKSKRSMQREKLEKTFKEKGFLIQTQQLESAEGSTYCKFRQLRKFTRYLFRSWKDYLPGNIQNMDGDTASSIPNFPADMEALKTVIAQGATDLPSAADLEALLKDDGSGNDSDEEPDAETLRLIEQFKEGGKRDV